jgi:hypothetical protein
MVIKVDISALDRAILKAESDIDNNTLTVLRKVSLVVDQAVVLATPVDTGRARSNWITSLNMASTKIIPEGIDKSGSAAMAQNMDETAKVKLTDVLFICNNLPYIGGLNDGHSKQAAANFIQRAAQVAKNIKD